MKKKLFWICAEWKGDDGNFKVLFFTAAASSLADAKFAVTVYLRKNETPRHRFGNCWELPNCFCETDTACVIQGTQL